MIRSISAVDLLSFEESKEILLSEDYSKLYSLLYDVGFDISSEIEYQVCLHRPMSMEKISKEPVEAGRWVGRERTDDVWMNSGYATFENKLEIIGKKDVAFQKELLEMNRRPNFTAMACEFLEGKN